ncbi:MAG: PQQ-binding-like beta-propeller repeat protein [Candidatus Brocadiia bacterium]
MDCSDVQRDLEPYVLGGLSPQRESGLRHHLAGCPGCRAEERDCRRLVAELRRQAPQAAPREGFERALRAAVDHEARARRRRCRVRRLAAAAGLAAAVLLVGLAAHALWRGEDSPAPTGLGHGGERQPESAARSVERWRYPHARAVPAGEGDRAVVCEGRLYVLGEGARGAEVVAIDLATGAPRWRSRSHSLGYLAADRRRVYCLAAARGGIELMALDTATGEELWRHSPQRRYRPLVPCTPVPLGHGRVAWTTEAMLRVLEADTGRELWRRQVDGEGPLSCGAAQARGGKLYVVSHERLRCLAVDSGEEVWAQPLLPGHPPGPGRPLVALGQGRLYVALPRLSARSQLSCIDLETRELAWRRPVPWARCLLATRDGVYARGRHVVALERDTGEPLWRRDAEGCGPLTCADGLVYFVDSRQEGRLVAVEPRTGHTAWELAGFRSCGAFTRVGSTGYVKTQDGVVHAIALAGGGRS